MEPRGIDDLKLIHGIGPAVEQRLHGVGIDTFAKLAALTPADIAASVSDLAGLTAERIHKQDWIGQARRLVIKPAATMQEETAVPPIVKESQIKAESQAATSLPEVPRNGEISPVESEPAGVTNENEPGVPLRPVKGLDGILRLRSLEMIGSDVQAHPHFLSSDRPFEVMLTLDLSDVQIPIEAPLTYAVSLFGRSMSKPSRLLIGHEQGTMLPTGQAAIKVQGKALPRGLYRLEALVTLNQTVGERESRPGLTAQLEERLLQFA